METSPYWIPDAPQGRLAISPEPACDDFLRDELADWKQQGANIVVSLLSDEEMELDGLTAEPQVCEDLGLEFRRFPIADHGLPHSGSAFVELIEALHAEAQRDRAIVVHCFAGIGRSTLVAASLLMRAGLTLEKALEHISEARGTEVPDTPAQALWLEHLAARLRGTP
jgi:protein-tyrosine phosphatase